MKQKPNIFITMHSDHGEIFTVMDVTKKNNCKWIHRVNGLVFLLPLVLLHTIHYVCTFGTGCGFLMFCECVFFNFVLFRVCFHQKCDNSMEKFSASTTAKKNWKKYAALTIYHNEWQSFTFSYITDLSHGPWHPLHAVCCMIFTGMFKMSKFTPWKRIALPKPTWP